MHDVDDLRARRLQGKRLKRFDDGLLVAVLGGLAIVLIASWLQGGDANASSFKSEHYRQAAASCYGPGLYGNLTANGTTLRPSTLGVAHKSIRMGTKIQFRSGSKTVVVRVIDRGPFSANRAFDLTSASARKLGVSSCSSWGVRNVKWRIVK